VQDGFSRIDQPSAAEAMELEIGDIINQVEAVLKDRRLVDFFRELDTEKTAKITTKTLHEGLNRLLRPTAFLNKRLMEKERLIHPLLSQYEQVEVKTVLSATKIVHFERSGVAAIVRNLEGRMKERGMRINDLFTEMDIDGDGTVSGPELSKMLTVILQPPADVQAAVKIRKQKMEATLASKAAADEETSKLEFQLKEAEESGAHVAMAAFAEYMRVHACRVIDVFRMIDSSGDGVCDLEELYAMIEIVGLDMKREDMKKMMDYLDDDGSGTLDAEELNRAVRDFRRAKWARRMVAVAKQAKYATTLDRGIINRREANIFIKYLSSCYTVKRIPLLFLNSLLAANTELRKDSSDVINLGAVKEEPRMGYPWQAKVTYKGEAANFKELWPDTLTATTHAAAFALGAAD
jgi:Ca2+-binding EF-hand superfamily protein